MDAIIRCPFLSRVPQTFFQQARKTLVSYAVKCPVMMDLASKPLVRSICSSSSIFQKSDDVINTGKRIPWRNWNTEGGKCGLSQLKELCAVHDKDFLTLLLIN